MIAFQRLTVIWIKEYEFYFLLPMNWISKRVQWFSSSRITSVVFKEWSRRIQQFYRLALLMHSDAIAQGKEATLNKLQYVWGWIWGCQTGVEKIEKSPYNYSNRCIIEEFLKKNAARLVVLVIFWYHQRNLAHKVKSKPFSIDFRFTDALFLLRFW
jgi:hypothetical protein